MFESVLSLLLRLPSPAINTRSGRTGRAILLSLTPMPVIRHATKHNSVHGLPALKPSQGVNMTRSSSTPPVQTQCNYFVKLLVDSICLLELSLAVTSTVYYPQSETERSCFRTNSGKVCDFNLSSRCDRSVLMGTVKLVTPHQWAVYDFTRKVPLGKVATYKDVSLAVGGSPRSGR